MALTIGVPRETLAGEKRVATVPEVVEKLIKLGFSVAVESGAGDAANCDDDSYRAAGATIIDGAAQLWAASDIVFKVGVPTTEEVGFLREGGTLIGFVWPAQNSELMQQLAAKKATVLAIDSLPRQLSRAQKMDALTSQAGVAGYRAVIEAAEAFGRAFPMMMTAAGTIPAAKVFVMGVGVAGLQAIATARRLGAVVTATDVRPATKEQVESLGAKFLAVEDEEFKNAQTAGGYAKEMSKEYQAKQAALTAEHVKKQDIVITTALIPGRPAPKLISAEMVKSMKPGSVLVDLAVERGGNVEGAKAGEVADVDGIKIVGYTNVAGRVAASASSLYARNLFNFIETLVDKTTKALDVKWDDELVKATALTKDGAVIHPNFQPKA